MASEKNMIDREAVRSVVQQWNANRLDLFALSEPDENLLFHGVMRFYFQDAGQKVATKCIRVASDATVADVIDTLISKFRPDMRMLSVPNYTLYEVHSNGEERKLNQDEKPLLVQLNWHIDDREGRFLLKNIDQKPPIEHSDVQFHRKLSKRENREQKKKEKNLRQNWKSVTNTENEIHVGCTLYNEIPETSFTRSISNPEAVMRRRRQQKLEKKLQQFMSKDGGPDTGGTLKIYGESLCHDVPYKTLLLSIRDCAQAVVREMLSKYGLDKTDPLHYCLVQVNCDGTAYILDDDECPLSILMNHPTSRGSIMFHVRRRPADAQPRRRKKKPLSASNGNNISSSEREGPVLMEITHSGDIGRLIKLGPDSIEVGSANTNSLQLFGPSIQARHCVISLLEGVCTVTPLHADALTFVNGHHISQPTILHNGSVVMIGRVSSYRFLDSTSNGRFNLALSQSQLDSVCLYESRSPTLPASCNKEDERISTSRKGEVERVTYEYNTNIELGDEYKKQQTNKSMQKQLNAYAKEIEFNYEATEQILDSETKSISSLKSAESQQQDERSQNKTSGLENQGHDLILPAVLEFPENHQEQFLSQILTELDVNLPHFKLAPAYALYLCARYRASTHFRIELQPTERAHKLTIFLQNAANLICSIIQGQYTNARVLTFWMANSSEFLNFLKSDRHISAFSTQAQDILAESVQSAFHNLVNCFRAELSQTLNQFLSDTIAHDSAAGLVLTCLGSAMALLRRCRVNAALTIQLFSQLFHYINAVCFNTIVTNSDKCTAKWGNLLTERLLLLELWAESQGLELAADCHLAKINQCAQFLQSSKTSVEEIQALTYKCFRLNSVQMAALLQKEKIPRNLIDTAIRMAQSVADELIRADGREVRLEESPDLHLVLLLPDDGFSCDVVRGIPSGLLDFLNPLQSAGICRLAAQPTSIGLWTVYMHQFNAPSPSEMSNKLLQPEVQKISLQKNSNGMGLSIVAAKGAGQEQLGIYIKSVVPGGAAEADNRLQAGDQLLRVDGHSLVGITQERAADYLVRTGPVVTLEVSKQGAIYHGLATLLQQPSPIVQRGNRSQKETSLIKGDLKNNEQLGSNLTTSKSVPIFQPNRNTFSNDKCFYQNLSAYRVQNQRQQVLGERPATESSRNSLTVSFSKRIQHLNLPNTQQLPANQNSIINRPSSAYYEGSTYANYIENTYNTPNVLPKNVSAHNAGNCSSSLNVNVNGCLITKQLNAQNRDQTQLFFNIGKRSKSAQNFQSQNRMTQMLAPSMPNISDTRITSSSPHICDTGLISSQSMQNVALINNATSESDASYQKSQNEQQRFQKSVHGQQQTSENSSCFQPSLREIPIRRDYRTGGIKDKSNQMVTLFNNQQDVQKQQELFSKISVPLPKTQRNKDNLTTFSKTSFKPQQPQNISNSQPVHTPQNYKKDTNVEETPPLPPTTTHPLFKSISQPTLTKGLNSVANFSETDRDNYYTINASLPHQGQVSVANPWECEERENIRIWRDKQITNFSNLSHQFPQQGEQLKTLVLENEFDRRAHEFGEQKEDNESSFNKENDENKKNSRTPLSSTSVSYQNLKQRDNEVSRIWRDKPKTNLLNLPHPQQDEHLKTLVVEKEFDRGAYEIRVKEEDKELSFHKENDEKEEKLRTMPSSIPLNTNQVKQDIECLENIHMNSKMKIPKIDLQMPVIQSQPSTAIQPKGILKNIRHDSSSLSITTSFTLSSESNKNTSDEMPNYGENPVNSISKNASEFNLDLNPESLQSLVSVEHMSQCSSKLPIRTMSPPSPPQRNISYFVMSQKQQSTNKFNSSKSMFPSETESQNHNNNNVLLKNMPSQSLDDIYSSVNSNTNSSSLIFEHDIRRASFHDEDNKYITLQMPVSAIEPNHSNNIMEINYTCDSRAVSNDTLQSSHSPKPELWNLMVKSTPGVIGAQEVYRDPRQRRLAEQHNKEQLRSSDAVPEKLSFKEKMKMFALESGDGQTPKDKLKISRAQRDIDAAH